MKSLALLMTNIGESNEVDFNISDWVLDSIVYHESRDYESRADDYAHEATRRIRVKSSCRRGERQKDDGVGNVVFRS